MKPTLSFLFAVFITIGFVFAGGADPANHPYNPAQEKFFVEDVPASQVFASSDTTQLNQLATKVNETARKSLRTYVISTVLSVVGVILALLAVGSNAAGLAILAVLVILAAGIIGFISLIQLIIGWVKLKDLDETLMMYGDKNLVARYRARVSRARTILNVLAILTIISLIINVISSVINAA